MHSHSFQCVPAPLFPCCLPTNPAIKACTGLYGTGGFYLNGFYLILRQRVLVDVALLCNFAGHGC